MSIIFVQRKIAMVSMIERMKMSRDKREYSGAVLMDLSKPFDTINHELLVAKMHAYGFSIDALKIVHSYLSDRWHRTKIDGSYKVPPPHLRSTLFDCGRPCSTANKVGQGRTRSNKVEQGRTRSDKAKIL